MNITIIHTLSPEVIELFKGFLVRGGEEKAEAPAKREKKMQAVAPTTLAESKKESVEGTTTTTVDSKKDDADDDITLTLEIVRAKSTETAQKGEKQKNEVKALLAEFGVQKVTALDSAKYTEFYNKLKKIA